MAIQDIRLRYKRTKLGPFWLIIVSFISTVCIAGLGSLLFRVKWGDIFPYTACGLVIWNYISATITESCGLYVGQAGVIKHVNASLLTFGLRSFARNTIIFAHNFPILAMILMYYQVPIGWSILWIIPALLLYMMTSISLAILLGFVCTRFRDIMQLVQAIMGLLYILTPIMWKPEMLGRHAYLANYNPLTHYFAILREPLLGKMPATMHIMMATCISSSLLFMAILVYNKYRKQVVHWL